MINRHAGLRLLVAVALIAWLPACGSGVTPPPPPPPPTATPLPPFVIFQSAFPPLQPGDFAFGDFTIGAPGTVRATMDWTFPTNQMFLFIMAGTICSQQDFVRFVTTGASPNCTILGMDIEPATKPATLSFNATQPTGARVFVLNLGPTGESGVVQITLQR